jgi:CMP-N-acetylneuraminic acid synthetase
LATDAPISESEVLGVITARGGSRGIPGKNLALVGDRPLVVHAVLQAAAARTLSRTVVSTDSEDIAKACREAGGDVPFLRPAALARDETPTLPVLLHALRSVEAETGRRYEYICCLQPTSPLRLPEDIDRAVTLAIETGADSVVTVCPAPHPAKIKKIENDRLVPYAVPEPEGVRRQDLGPPAFRRNGAVYVFRRDTLLAGKLWGDDCRAVVMPPERSIDIDSPPDLELARVLFCLNEPGREP